MAGFEDKAAPLKIIQEVIAQLKGQLMEMGILRELPEKKTIEEAEQIGHKSLEKLRGKHGDRQRNI